jgi:hypothetical protein
MRCYVGQGRRGLYEDASWGPYLRRHFGPKGSAHWGIMWFYAYQDQDGTLSNAAPIPFSSFLQGNPTTRHVSERCVYVRPAAWLLHNDHFCGIYRAVFNSGTNQYDVYRETVVPLMNGIYTSDGTTAGTSLVRSDWMAADRSQSIPMAR